MPPFFSLFQSSPRRKLSLRLLVAILLFSSVITLFAAGTQLFFDYRRDLGDLESQLENVRRFHLPNLTTSLWKLDREQIETELSNIILMRDILQIRIQGELGQVYQVGRPPLNDEQISSKSFPMVFEDQGKAHSIGQLTVTASLEGIYERLLDRVLVIIATQGLKTFLVSAFILFLVHFLVTGPITHLSQRVHKIRTSTDLNEPVVLHREDEIGLLAEDFNSMQEALRQHYAKLEEKVRERTEQLQKERDSAQRYLDTAGVMLLALDRQGNISLINKKGCEILGAPENELIGKEWFSHFLPPDQLETVREYFDQLMKGDIKPVEYAVNPIINHKGEERLISWHNAVVRDAQQQIIGTFSSGEDITERMLAEDQVNRFNLVLEQSLNEIYIFDSETLHFLDVNLGARTNLGYSMEELSQLTPLDLKPEFTMESFADMISPLKSGAKDKIEFTTVHRRKDGTHYPVEVHLQLMGGRNSVFVAVILDITERKRAMELIEHQATYDALTDLPNRRLLLDRMEHFIARFRRHGHVGAILFIDLDNFKHINDSLGHPIGDALLQEVAKRLQTELRKEDTTARLGGDEFVVMFSELSDQVEQAAKLAQMGAEKIQKVLSAPYEVHQYKLHLTPSIGIAMMPMEDESANDILMYADTAMYQAKEAGRNTIRFFLPDMQAAAEERLKLQNDLLQALQQQEFELHFQPQVDAAGAIISGEVLLRWRHPKRGNVSPVEFIPVAEESGQILSIGAWVLTQALIQLKTWSDNPAYASIKGLSVNVSPQQFQQVDFTRLVERIVSETGVNPGMLTLEFTEGVLIENLEDAIKKIRSLKKLGIRFSIDDFGTGYSSLAYLKRLPVDEIKIDQSFVRDITTDPGDAKLVESIISIAEQFSLEVVAEGVETVEQLQFLKEKGCGLYQGYYFSRPIPGHKFAGLLTKGATAVTV